VIVYKPVMRNTIDSIDSIYVAICPSREQTTRNGVAKNIIL